MTDVELRHLGGESTEVSDLQRVLEDAPAYHMRVTGAPAGVDAAEELLRELPDGWTADDKFVYGIYLSGRMVGCVDILRGYPDGDCAFIGLLLVGETWQAEGVGRAAYEKSEAIMRTWGVGRIRLAVLETNGAVVRYWKKMGFALTGERLPYSFGAVESHVLFLEKQLPIGV